MHVIYLCLCQHRTRRAFEEHTGINYNDLSSTTRYDFLRRVRTFCDSMFIVNITDMEIWRMTHDEYFRHLQKRFPLPLIRDGISLDQHFIDNAKKPALRRQQRKGRMFIAFALLLQVKSQWTVLVII